MTKRKNTTKNEDLKNVEKDDRLAYLIDIAKDVPQLPDEVKTDQIEN